MRGELPSLTPQEQRVAMLIGRGYTSAQIATELGVDTSTATHHVSEVLSFMRRRGRLESGEAPRLSRRELQVIERVQRGATDRAIAEELGISLRTAQDHVHRILKKLGLRRRQELSAIDAGGSAPR